MDVGIEIQGARTVDLRFDKFPEDARANLVKAITASTDELADMVRLAAPKRTGKLAASVQQRVTDSERKISGIVSVTADFGKAGALEYGSHKTISVREHVARSTTLFGALNAPTDVIVAAHNRTLNLDPRDFLRGPLNAVADGAFEGMEEAMQEAAVE